VDIIDSGQLGDERWDQLCGSAIGAWFWHTTSWRDYTLAYSPALESRTLAFAVVDAGRPVALVPLMVENIPENGGRRMSFGGDACWSPALVDGTDPSRRAVAMRNALDHIDALAKEEEAKSVALRLSPLAIGADDHLSLFLATTTRAGYLDVSLCSQVIDLDVGPALLRSAMTKGHRADVTRGRRTLVATVSTGDEAVADFSGYRAMHALAAGRVTRPPTTFELMETWLVNGRAALVKATKDGCPVGYAYLVLYRDAAYYGSAANHPDHERDPIGHVMHAASMEWLQERGIRRYELGMQQFGPLPHDLPSERELRIARFKRGFGGRSVPLVIREKWFSPEAYRQAWETRNARYMNAVWSTS